MLRMYDIIFGDAILDPHPPPSSIYRYLVSYDMICYVCMLSFFVMRYSILTHLRHRYTDTWYHPVVYMLSCFMHDIDIDTQSPTHLRRRRHRRPRPDPRRQGAKRFARGAPDPVSGVPKQEARPVQGAHPQPSWKAKTHTQEKKGKTQTNKNA